MNFPSIYDQQNEALTIIEDQGSDSQYRGIPTTTATSIPNLTCSLQPSYLSYNHKLRQAVAAQGRYQPHPNSYSQYQDQDEQRVVEILTGDLDSNHKNEMRSDYGQYRTGYGGQQAGMGMGMGKVNEEGMTVDWYGSPDGELGMGMGMGMGTGCTTMNGSQGQGQGYTYEDEGRQSARGSVDASVDGGVGLGQAQGQAHGSVSSRGRIGSGSSGLSFIPFEEDVGYDYGEMDGDDEFEYDGQQELKGLGLGFGSGVATGHAHGNEQQEDLADFDEYNIVAGPPADYYRDQMSSYGQQQQPLSATYGQQQQHQQHGYDEYYGNYNRKVSSYAQRGASPFGAIGSETNRFDPFGQNHAQHQQQHAQGYVHPQAQVKSYEEQYYAVDQAQVPAQVEEHVVAAAPAAAPSPEEALAASGVGLSGFLAEAVWELCMLPFEPAKRALEEGSEGYDAQYGYGKGYDQYGNGDVYSAYGRHYSGYSSPDLVSLRELQEPHSGYASPVTMSSPISASMNPYNLRSKPSQAFVEFVHRTLSQTLLSPTAVILALWYIRRLAIHTGGEEDGLMLRQMLHVSANGTHGPEEAARRILTLGLMFSNKNLDDNTFTNKSWSDVTHLPLVEINRIELHALGPLKFDLSITHLEWETWVHTVERRVTPFIADGLAVQNAIHAMHLALRMGRARFEEEIVVRREQAEMEAQKRERGLLGHHEAGAGRKAYYTASTGEYNWSPAHTGTLSPSYMSQTQERGLPSIAALADGIDVTGLKSGYPQPGGQSYEAYSNYYRQHQSRAQAQTPSASAYPSTGDHTRQYNQGYLGYPHSGSHSAYEQENRHSGYGNGYQANQNLNLGNQYYLSHMAASHGHGYGQQHQPRMMSIMA